MVTFRAAVASCPRKSGNHNGDNFYFNSKFITEELSSSQVMLAHKKSQTGIQMYAVSDGFMAERYSDEISLMLVRGLKKYHARLIEDTDLDPVAVIESYNREAYAAAKRRSLANDHRPYASIALMYIDGDSVVITNAGNVKVFRIRRGAVELLTEEHTQAHKMLELGLITPERAENHPQRRKLTQFYGVMPEEISFDPPIISETAKVDDMYVICSCGCYENISEVRMAEIYEETENASDFVKKVFTEAVSGGCRDDITVLAVKAESSNAAVTGGASVSHTVSAHSEDRPMRGAATAGATGANVTRKNAQSTGAPKSVNSESNKKQVDQSKDDSQNKKGGAGAAIKAFLGIGAEDSSEQIWPALVVFGICLVLVIILTIYGINIYNKTKGDEASSSQNPYGTQDVGTSSTATATPSDDATEGPASTTPPTSSNPQGTNPSFVNTDKPVSTATPDDEDDDPTSTPSAKPTEEPTGEPTEEPTSTPTTAPTEEPTSTPTETPSEEPTATPTETPSEEPTATPTETPSEEPTATPTVPTEEPTATPTETSATVEE